MTPSVCALSLMGSRLAKMLNEKKTNISMTEKSICPFKHCIAAANARLTLPHLSVSRCRALAGT